MKVEHQRNSSLTTPHIVEINGEPHTIRTPDELKDFVRSRVLPVTREGETALVRRGPIDRSSFPFHQLSFVNYEWRGAYPHAHHTDVALVPEDDVTTGTLLLDKGSVMRRIHELVQQSKWRELLGNLSRHVPELLGECIQRTREASENPGEGETRTVETAFGAFRKLMENVFSARIYPFLREIQLNLGTDFREIVWQNCDIILLRRGAAHARDIRQYYRRPRGAQLRYVRFREKNPDPSLDTNA